jgi:hypothetical protein
MVGLRGRAPKWDRFNHWAPGAAILVLLFSILLLAAAAITDRSELEPESVPAPSTELAEDLAGIKDESRDADLALYDVIAERVAAGENYHAVAVEEQRARDFPVRPGLAVRLPTLAFLTAWLGPDGMMVLAGALALLTFLAWYRRLGDEPGGPEHRTIALLLLVIGAGMGLKPQYLVLHEVWAGLLLALSFGLHKPGKWMLAWLAAAAALAIREHALPFVLLMGAFALFRRDWRETAAWGFLVLAFLIGLAAHLVEVNQLISDADPASPSWLVSRGLGGWTSNIVLSSTLYLLPGVVAAPLALIPLLGWAGWKSDAGLFGLLLFAGYGIFFMFAGRDNNFYWALMVTPCWFMGLAFLPRSIRSLWNSARGH